MTMTEVTTEYCKVCGHAKEHHDLNAHVAPKEARDNAEQGGGACRDMSFGEHHCICVGYQSWV